MANSFHAFFLVTALTVIQQSAHSAKPQPVFPGGQWEICAPADVGMDARRLAAARDYALTGGGSGYITRYGRLVMAWGDPRKCYDLKSTTKSIGVTALGLAMADRKMRLNDRAIDHHPQFGVPPESNRETGWVDRITIQQLATQTAGFEKPGGYTRLMFAPGTKWSYSDGGPNWLAECITLTYQRDLAELMFERIFRPIGIDHADLVWRRNSYRDATIEGVMRREFGSGISANVDAMARIGYLYLRQGSWRGRQLLPRDFVRAAGRPVRGVSGLPVVDPEVYGHASDHYGLLWWNNADGALDKVPRDAFWSWGLYDSLIVVIPSLDIVAARAGQSWQRKGNAHYEVLRPFLERLAVGTSESSEKRRATTGSSDEATRGGNTPPFPPSEQVKGIQWEPAATVVRRAAGSDNWPLTWGRDGSLYTAYGDGRGFKPWVERKLSLGLARIEGGPSDFTGINLRSAGAERYGDGAAGPKASGMVMINGVLYMLVRNVHNAQLAWSSDGGRSWKWSHWKFGTSFGCPTFLNFGRDYEGARDEYVYIYSPDSDSAYERADRMVLARAPVISLSEREAWEFFQGLDADGRPVWTSDIAGRGAVLSHPGCCYRSSVSYHPTLHRYLWCYTIGGDDLRFRGGLVIVDGPEPWGPWTTVFYTPQWDMGPGESASLPTKWISADGRTIHLVFSGDDCFSVRRGQLQIGVRKNGETGLSESAHDFRKLP